MKKKVLLVFLVILIIIFIGIGIFYFIFREDYSKYGETNEIDMISYVRDENNRLKWMKGNFSQTKVNNETDALLVLEEIKEDLEITDVKEQVKFDYKETVNGITYYHFSEIYQDILVMGQTLILSVDKDGNVLSYSGSYIPLSSISITKLKDSEINKILKDKYSDEITILKKEEEVWALDHPKFIYDIIFHTETELQEVIIDAETKEILMETLPIDQAEDFPFKMTGLDGLNYTIHLEKFFDVGSLKNRYRFHDITRDIYISDYSLLGGVSGIFVSALPGKYPIEIDIENGSVETGYSSSFLKSAVSAMKNYAIIYDFYKDVLGRDSYDGKGSPIVINLGVKEKLFSKQDLNNAFWASIVNQMFIGDYKGKSFADCLDVLAHEFTHGVNNHIVTFQKIPKNKNEANETGALNEAYADVLAHLIEGKNWTISENIEIGRDASDPSRTGDPSVKNDEYYFPNKYLKDKYTVEDLLKANHVESLYDLDKGGVHTNMNVVTHAAYLMYEYGAFKNKQEMAKVWYQSLYLLPSDCNFEDAALAVLSTAESLGLSNDSLYQIRKAFVETKMLDEKTYSVEINVFSNDISLDDVTLEVTSEEESYHELMEIDKTFHLDLLGGVYHFKFSKDGFTNYEVTLMIDGDTFINASLANEKKMKQNKVTQGKNLCTSTECVKVTWHFLGENNLENTSEVMTYNKGIVLDSSTIIDTINKSAGFEMVTGDGENFYFQIGPVPIQFGWYYYNTDTLFDWNEPVNEDIEIEMRLLNGTLDFDAKDDMTFDIEDVFEGLKKGLKE